MTFLVLYIASLFNISSTPIDINPFIDLPSTISDDVTVQDDIKWYSWAEAQELSKTQPKKVFIDLYTSWCGWCKKMDKTTFKDPAVVKYLNDHFYPVKFDAERKDEIVFNEKKFGFVKSGRRGVHQLAYALLDGRLGYPAFVTLDETFARITISPGYKQPAQLLKELEFAKEEQYMEMSFDEYMAKAD